MMSDAKETFKRGDLVVLNVGRQDAVMRVERVWCSKSVECVMVGGLGMTSYHPPSDLHAAPKPQPAGKEPLTQVMTDIRAELARLEKQ